MERTAPCTVAATPGLTACAAVLVSPAVVCAAALPPPVSRARTAWGRAATVLAPRSSKIWAAFPPRVALGA